MSALVLADGLLQILALSRQLGLPLFRSIGDEIVDRMPHTSHRQASWRLRQRIIDRGGVEGGRVQEEMARLVDGVVGGGSYDVGRVLQRKAQVSRREPRR